MLLSVWIGKRRQSLPKVKMHWFLREVYWRSTSNPRTGLVDLFIIQQRHSEAEYAAILHLSCSHDLVETLIWCLTSVCTLSVIQLCHCLYLSFNCDIICNQLLHFSLLICFPISVWMLQRIRSPGWACWCQKPCGCECVFLFVCLNEILQLCDVLSTVLFLSS